MRIVGLMNDRPANAEYRVVLPLWALGQRGHETELHVWTPDLPERLFSSLRTADAVLMWRLYQGAERRLATALRDAGVAVVWDNDDDMVRVRPQVNTDFTVAREQAHRELSAMMRLADAVTTTSPELARRFRKMGAGAVRVIDNYISPDAIRPPRPPHDGALTIGWVAGSEHRADLKQLQLRSALERVLRRHEHVRLMSYGLDLGIRNERYSWHPGTSFAELPDAVAQFDIGIAPIADVSFNRARSRVKLKEYAAAGVPWLASPIGPYRGMGEEQGGRLVPDPLWQRRLEELIGDEEARRGLAVRAAAWARTETVVAHVEVWEETVGEAVGRGRGRVAGTSSSNREVPGDDGAVDRSTIEASAPSQGLTAAGAAPRSIFFGPLRRLRR